MKAQELSYVGSLATAPGRDGDTAPLAGRSDAGSLDGKRRWSGLRNGQVPAAVQAGLLATQRRQEDHEFEATFGST